MKNKTTQPKVPGVSEGRWPYLRRQVLGDLAVILAGIAVTASAQTTGKKPNILMIMGDDIGWFNLSERHSVGQ